MVKTPSAKVLEDRSSKSQEPVMWKITIQSKTSHWVWSVFQKFALSAPGLKKPKPIEWSQVWRLKFNQSPTTQTLGRCSPVKPLTPFGPCAFLIWSNHHPHPHHHLHLFQPHKNLNLSSRISSIPLPLYPSSSHSISGYFSESKSVKFHVTFPSLFTFLPCLASIRNLINHPFQTIYCPFSPLSRLGRDSNPHNIQRSTSKIQSF